MSVPPSAFVKPTAPAPSALVSVRVDPVFTWAKISAAVRSAGTLIVLEPPVTAMPPEVSVSWVGVFPTVPVAATLIPVPVILKPLIVLTAEKVGAAVKFSVSVVTAESMLLPAL